MKIYIVSLLHRATKNYWPDSAGKQTIGVLTMPTDGERGSTIVSSGAETGIGVRSMPALGDRGSSSRGKKWFGGTAVTDGGDENWDWSSLASNNPNSRLLAKPPISAATGITNI